MSIDIEKLAIDSCMEEAVPGLFYSSRESLGRFAALLLEQAAQACESEHMGEVDEDWHNGYNTAIRDVSEAIRHMKQEAE